ncbi:MAG: AI-2E family transporter [Patescibacteria group bacterium]
MSSIIKILLVLLLLAFLYAVRDVVLIIFVSLVFASAIDPWIDSLQKRRKMPRFLSILLIYILVIGVVVLAVSLLVPAISNQVGQLTENFPNVVDRIISGFSSAQQTNEGASLLTSIQGTLENVNQSLSKITSSIFSGIASLFGGIVMLIGILFLTFYMTLEEQGVEKFVKAIAPVNYQPYFIQLIRRIQERLGLWLRGQLILGLIIGALSFVGLVILGVPYPLVLALIAGITELVPIIGPILGAIPAVFIALTVSPWKALFVIILYLVIQQLENNLVVPKVMQRVAGLNPIVVIIIMLIGAKLAGIVGIILAVPAAIIGDCFLHDLLKKRRQHESFSDADKESEKNR